MTGHGRGAGAGAHSHQQLMHELRGSLCVVTGRVQLRRRRLRRGELDAERAANGLEAAEAALVRLAAAIERVDRDEPRTG